VNLVITHAEVDGTRCDLQVVDGVVAAIGNDVAVRDADEVVDAGGGALLPGLHDHHLHLFAMAAANRSVICGPPAVTDLDGLAVAFREAPGGGWIRGVGYHESVAGPLDRDDLDRLAPHRPARVQHRSGGLWILNTKAVESLGIKSVDGRLWRRDDLVRTDDAPPELADVGRALLEFGITGVTDATPDLDAAAMCHLAASVESGAVPQSITALGAPDDWVSPWVAAGPRKLLLHDHDLPSYDVLAGWIRETHATSRAVAVHCVTRVSLLLTLAALEAVGVVPGDRIEHAAVVPSDVIAHVAALGVRVVTQPGFIAERGDDYLRDVDPDDVPCLYRYASLRAAGIAVAPSSDAPYADPDPWRTMAAARDRRTAGGHQIGPTESVPPETVLAGYLSAANDPGGQSRAIKRGARAALCLLHVPLSEALRNPSRDHVRLVLAGQARSS
jgi:predicted amidohydrolase YtcJ